MGETAREGRTILFVSHSMAALESLCNRVMWIDAGSIVQDGAPRQVIASYIESTNKTTAPRQVGVYSWEGHRRGTGEVQFGGFQLLNESNEPATEFQMGETVVAEAEFTAHANVENAVFSFSVVDAATQAVVTTWVGRRQPLALSDGERGIFRIVLPENTLRARRYFFSLGVASAQNNDIPFDVWAGGGTEFYIGYPEELEDLDILVGHDAGLVSLPVRVEFQTQ
jgi:hypothetical protein